MKNIKSLKSRLVLQLAIIVLPMMAIFLYQSVSNIHHSESLERSYFYLAACQTVKLKYAQFVNGAVDAVDTGQLGSDALRALDDAAKELGNLAQGDRTGNVRALQGEITLLLANLRHDRSIGTLKLSRVQINKIDTGLADEYLRYETENRRAIEENIAFAKTQRKIVSGALIAVFAGLLMAFLISLRIIGSVRACMDFAGRIAGGDLTSRMASEGWKEFRALAASLNSMSEALQSSQLAEEKRATELEEANESLQNEIAGHRSAEKEILRLNEKLEFKVEERTKQLVEAQEELIHSEKQAILGLISANMGNELRNPLGVMSNAVFYLKTVMADTDDTVREYLEIIGQEIDNSQGIISELVDFNRISTPASRAVPVYELINQSLARCAIPENVRLQADLPESSLAVQIDPKQMVRVLQNLVTNAVQAMPNGGALHLSARLIRNTECGMRNEGKNSALRIPHSAFDEDFIEISVTDTGVGIAPENMEKIFQPLFSTKSRGIGLGLVVCKKLVEANGGRLAVESEFGKGTTFTVILPAEEGGTWAKN